MYYVPGFSNYLEDQILSEEAPLDGGLAGSYQSLPAQQPVYSEPYYGDQYYSDPYVESYQSAPTSQPVEAVPYYEEAAPVAGIGYQQVPTLQPVEAAPVYTAPTSGPSDFYASTYVAPTWSPGMDPSMRPGWQPDEAGMAELGAWLQSSPNSILNSPLYSTTVPQAAQDYIKEQAAQGKTLIYDPATQAALGSAISPFISTGVSYKPFDPNNPMANMGQVFKFTTYGDEPNAPVVFQPGQTYSLYDYKGENLLGQAKTPEELQALIDLSNQRQAQGWTLKGDNVPDYAGGGFGTGSAGGIYGRAPQDNTLKTVVLAGLTAMGAGALGPFIQGAGAIAPGAVGAAATPLGAGLAAAGVNTVGNLATGASLGDALKSGALAGLSTAAMTGLLGGGGKTPNVGDMQMNALDAMNALGVNSELAGQIASGPLSGIGSAGGGGLGAGGGSFVGSDALGSLITVPGKVISGSIPSSFLSGALGAASGALSGTNYGDQVWGDNAAQQPNDQTLEQQFDEILVKGDKLAGVPATGSPGVSISSPSTSTGTNTNPEIVVTGAREPLQSSDGNASGVGGLATDIVVTGTRGPLQNTSSSSDNASGVGGLATDIVVTGAKGDTLSGDNSSELNSVLAPFTNLSGNLPDAPATGETTDPKKGLSTLDYIQLASLGIGALGDLFGGNKGNSGAKISGSMGGLNPVFGAQLPGANLPGLTGSTGGPRPASESGLNTTQDWYRYGYGPEQSFFSYVPKAQPNTSQAYTGYREGGFAVRGAGDGREDKIPAMLSDGEYVIDAETVALLGNGSNKAGAGMLDKFRVNIRKHKGRELARGDFSKNAKRPEQYLAGGRA